MNKRIAKNMGCIITGIVMTAVFICADLHQVYADEMIAQDSLIQEYVGINDNVELTNIADEEASEDNGFITADSLSENELSYAEYINKSKKEIESESEENIANEKDITVEPDAADSSSNPKPVQISINTLYQNEETDTEGKYYKFTLPQAGRVSFSIRMAEDECPDIGPYSYVWKMKLYNSNIISRNSEVENFSYTSKGGESVMVEEGIVGLRKGTFYLYISSNYNAEGYYYDLRVNFEASENWEQEIDSEDNPTQIRIGNWINGTMQYGYSYDFFKFDIPEDGKVSFSLKNPQIMEHNVFEHTTKIYIDVFGSNDYSNKDLIESIDYNGWETEEIEKGMIGLSKGTYYLCVTNGDMNTTELLYSIKVNFDADKNWEREIDTSTNPTPIDMDVWINGVLPSGDKDYYRFSMSKAGEISVSFKVKYLDRYDLDKDDHEWYIDIFCSDCCDDNYKLKNLKYIGKETECATGKTIRLDSGTYCISVSGGKEGAQYGLKVNYEREIDSHINPISINTNTWMDGILEKSDTKDYYKFSIPKAGEITIFFKVKYLDEADSDLDTHTWYIDLYSSDDYMDRSMLNCCQRYIGRETEGASSQPISLEKGTYYIRVSGGKVGAQYSIKVDLSDDTSVNYAVVFKSDNKVYLTQTVKQDELAVKPSDPVKEGYRFDGWYDSSYRYKYDFSSKVTSDVTLYAKWTKLTYDIYTNNLTLVTGQKVDIKGSCFPGLTSTASRYTISNTKIAAQSKDILKAKKAGSVEIKAQNRVDGNYEDIGVCKITILSKPKLKFNVSMTYEGQTMSASDYFSTKDVDASMVTMWESSKPEVIRVIDNKTGMIEAVGGGTARITAYFGQKGAKGTVKVTASLKVKVPKFAKSEYKVKVKSKKTIAIKNVTAAMNPEWRIEDESVATVENQMKNGKATGKAIVRGMAAGETTLIAVVDGREYKCKIRVTESR